MSRTATNKRRFSVRPTAQRAHDAGCDCGAAHAPTGFAAKLARWMPVIACLVCPACMSLYAKVFAALGVGVVLSKRAHGWILAAAVTLSIATSAVHAKRTKRRGSLAMTLGGAALVVSGHATGSHWLEWTGVLVLLVSGLLERTKRARPVAP